MEIKQATEAHKLVCRRLHYEYWDEGRDICVKGDESDKFYIIIEGQVQVLIPVEEKVIDEETGEERIIEIEEDIAQLNKGDHFGEIGLIKNQVRSATIRTMTDCHFAVLHKNDFLKILANVQTTELNNKVQFLQ